jgi:hypothetical protein
VISCGSGSWSGGSDNVVNLGYEPQWLMYKSSDIAGSNWMMWDTMRGMSLTASEFLRANLSDASGTYNSPYAIYPNATGFTVPAGMVSTGTYIYIAIRRGPMKVPTDATKVYNAVTGTFSTGDSLSVGFPADMYIDAWRTGTLYKANYSRLVNFANSNSSASQNYLKTNTTDAEITTSQAPSLYNLWNTTANVGSWNAGVSEVWWMFRRAPSFFDEVCCTVASSQVNHNLNVSPELVIYKTRSAVNGWYVCVARNGYGVLNSTGAWNASGSGSGLGVNFANVTSTTLSDGTPFYTIGDTVVAYLFATCAGVSKVVSYTGTGATQTINCGFAAGARFVLIKRTDTTGDWYVWDTARGMVSGTDPSLLLNSTAAEVNANSIYTATTGFQIVSTAAGINASGGSYIFLAIA